MKKWASILLILVLLVGCVFVVVDRAQAKICQPGAHGNLGCLDIDEQQPGPGKPAETQTPTATATQTPTPTRTPSPTPNICSIRGCE